MKNHTNGTGKANNLRRAMILIATIVTAIAVAVACALCLDVSIPAVDVDGVGSGDVQTSTTYNNRTGDLTAAGAIQNGDILNYAFTGGVVSVKLPRGTYKLQAWGAQGGTAGDYAGGKGGISTGTYEVTSTSGQYLYLCIGGQGGVTNNNTSLYASGGYNGGGRGYPSGGNTSSRQTSGGGGGATHIATTNRGVLQNYNSYRGEVIMVAGGGGGGGAWYGNSSERSAGGAGGGSSGGQAKNGLGNVANGGTQTSGYAFGLGGSGVHADQGGGGGGWFGGYAQTQKTDAYISGGGGGSGYVNPNLLTGYSTSTQTALSGAGKITITVVNVNRPPVTRNLSKTLFQRGSGNVVINASDIASDPEGGSVYFTNGTASNLDTFTTTANTGLFLNSACSTAATKYFDWTWTSNSQFKITNVKMYPRSGVDGSTANGSIVLYARVRDSYGTAGTMRGWAVIPFTVTVPVTNVAQAATAMSAPIDATTPGSSDRYTYYLGNSTTTTLGNDGNVAANNIYNPSATGRYTAMLSNSLRKNTSFTIKASDLVGGKFSGDSVVIALNSTTAITGNSRKFRVKEYDTANSPNKVTAYNASRVAIANAFDQISIECLIPEPGYQVFSVTLYVIEKSTAWGTSYPNVVPGCRTFTLDILFKMDNTRPTLKDTTAKAPTVTLNALQSQTVSLNEFFQDNDTPNGMSNSTHQILGVAVPSHEFIQLDKYGSVKSTLDKNNNSYFNIVPGDAALASDAFDNALDNGMLKGDAYKTGFEDWYISSGASDTAYVQYSINNSNLTISFTGLRSTYSMYSSARSGARAITSNKNNTVDYTNGVGQNAGHFYVLVHILDRNDSADAGIWLPIGIEVNNADPTDMSKERGGAGASVMPTANGNPGDVYYFTPMGITVNRVTYPIGARLDGNGNFITNDLQPLAADSDNFYSSNMLNGSGLGNGGVVGKLNELVTIASSADTVQNTVSGNSSGSFFTVEKEPIYIPQDYFGGRIKYESSIGTLKTVGGVDYVVVDGLKITLKDWTHNRYLYANVTVRDTVGRATSNHDVTVAIAVNVSNAAPRSYTSDEAGNVATLDYSANGMTVSSSYEPADGNSPATITYNIPMNSSVIVTPYDMLTDANMTAGATVGGFTLNGLSGVFDTGSKQLLVGSSQTSNNQMPLTGLGDGNNVQNGGTDYSSPTYIQRLKDTLFALQSTRTFSNDLSSGNLFSSTKESTKSAGVDRLYFARSTDADNLDGYKFNPYAKASDANSFVMPVVGDTFVGCTFGSSINFGSVAETYNVDYLIITANSRTQVGAPVEILLNVRDRMGNGASGSSKGTTTIRVKINVVNSSPRVQYPNKIYTLTTAPTQDASFNLIDTNAGVSIVPSTLVINAYGYTVAEDLFRNFLIDNENDTVMFYTGDPVSVSDGTKTNDDNDVPYLGNYLDVSLSSTQLTITARNSTQHIQRLYVEFSVTDGRYDGNELEVFRCRIQVEVINAAFTVNRGDDGFESSTFGSEPGSPRLNLWNVDTLDTPDITKTRYFASSSDIVTALLTSENYSISADQIRRLTNDSDRLQGVVLSAARNPNALTDSERGYYIATNGNYKEMVPYISTQASENGKPVAASVSLLTSVGSDSVLSDYFAAGNVAGNIDILYLVDGVIYSAKQLRSDGDTTVADNHEKFFDDQGRWIVTDWAIIVTPNKSTPSDEYIQVNIMMSDASAFGGGSMGVADAYNYKDYNGTKIAVNGFGYVSYHLSISSLGIVPYTYYDQFGGYYTVRDGVDATVNYISTYDGEVDSLYATGEGQSTLYLSDDGNINTSGNGSAVKTRSGGSRDLTAAGVHSGAQYAANVNYEYNVSLANGSTITAGEKAFKYSDTISVSGTKVQSNYVTTYIPMSYFGLRRSLVTPDPTTGAVSYPITDYVAYDVDGPYNRNTLSTISSAISISDGVNVWTGSSGAMSLDKNPYVSVTTWDAYNMSAVPGTNPLNESLAAYVSARNGSYFNKALAVPSVAVVDGSVKSLGYFGKDADVTAANANNLVGADGRMLYLADQQTKLQENLFGLGFTKKQTRSSASSLTVTIAIADCHYANSSTVVVNSSSDDGATSSKVTFKLEIGNSPIEFADNQSTNLQLSPIRNGGVNGVGGGYYYTDVELKTTDEPYTIGLVRQGSTGGNSKTLIRYTDEDCALNDDNTINEEKSDKAYFYADSMYQLSDWTNTPYANRVKQYDDASDNLVFENTSSKDAAQRSIANYFGSRNGAVFNSVTNKTAVDDIGSSFQPNTGKYGSNMGPDGTEGFSKFFTAAVTDGGSVLSITPISKTTINSGMYTDQNRAAYYAERGLEYNTQKGGYYPLKVLIYDSHGDGFANGSYIALEIRVYITGSAPTLSGNLEDVDSSEPGYVKGDKKIDIALPVGQSYEYNISNVIRSNGLLKRDNGNIFWEGDYTTLKNKANKTEDDMFNLDFGTYLKSPFNDGNYGWRTTSNADLLAGIAKLYDTKRVGDVYNVPIASQPDVVMSMDYTGGSVSGNKTTLSSASVPVGNTVTVTVNRRSTFDSQQHNRFTFKIVFTDSDNHKTNTLYINVEVTNQAPSIRAAAITSSANLKMRVNDSFTIVTTPYDKFTGVADGNTVSARNSTSYNYVVNNSASVSDSNLLLTVSDPNYNKSVKYSSLTTENVDFGTYKLHNYDPDVVGSQHLGYLAVADDDTPWALRITDISYYDPNCFYAAQRRDRIPLEGYTSGTAYALDMIVVARQVCTNMPVTITVVDAEGASVSFTIYVTVESTKPSPIPDNDNAHRRHEGLIGTDTSGVYELYMNANTENTAHLQNVSVNDYETVRTVKDVYGKVTFGVSQIAYDPDSTDNANIALYSESSEYDVFTFNDMPMQRDNTDPFKYFNSMFEINVSSDYKSFTLECKTFNPDSDWDELKFYVRDVGNNVFDNAVPITIRICTLNAELTNEHQAAPGNITNGVINNGIIDTVNVKAYDDYTGSSAEVQALPPEELAAIVNAPSTYQFLNYAGVAESVDQPNTDGWGINDADVINNDYNNNYDLRVYALMENSEENRRVFNSLTVSQASTLFDITPQQMQKRYWSLKRDNAGNIPSDVNKYFVGGVSATGGMYAGANNALIMYLQQYFMFDIGEDGVSLEFRPVTANIDMNVLFYVEVHKDLSARSITRSGASVNAGTLFYVKVKDSAPTVNAENPEIRDFSGKIGDSHIFKIFDSENEYESIFNDTDLADYVEINAFESKTGVDNDYLVALDGVEYDWKSRPGVVRAIDIFVNNDTVAVDGVPARSMRVDIRRRIDARDEDGNYLSEVTLPIAVTGTDREGRQVTTTLNVTIENTEMSFNDELLASSPRNLDAFGAGYEIIYDEESGQYVFNTYVVPDSASLSVNLVLDGWLVDADFTSMSSDTDSYRLVKPHDTVNINKYLIGDVLDVYPENDDKNPIAQISPILGNNGTNEDSMHFAGFSITSTSYTRGVTGVAYMRIIDRSSDPDTTDGVTIRVNVTVLNAVPNVIAGMDKKSYTIIGNDTKTSDPITIDIKDFVEDKNGDKVQIFGVAPSFTYDVHCSAEENNGGNILRVAMLAESDDAPVDKFTVVSRPGFYGTQSVLVTVADGDLATDFNARTVMFTVTFTVVYDFTQITEMNTINAVRSLPVKITPEKLFKDIKDTFDKTYVSSGNDGGNKVLVSAEESGTFNPGSDYVITELYPNDANVTVNHDSEGDWQFVCTREANISFRATFMRKVDVGNPDAATFTKTFNAVVGRNSAPVLIEQIRRNNEFTFHTREGDYGLDANGRVTLTTSMLFSDADLANGDRLTFDASVTEVVSKTMCTVEVSDDGLLLYITFHTRGETDFSVGVKDRTGETVKTTFKIKNIDRPAPSFMENIIISYESYPFIWLGAAAGLLLIILLIILIILLVKRRKRKQEELEAILLSEMELEEQMMRFAGGASSMPYQSFGYLPPTVPVQNDPGMMLGGGENTPQSDVIGLNPGQDPNTGSGGSSDSNNM